MTRVLEDKESRVYHAAIVAGHAIDGKMKMSFAEIIEKDSPRKNFGFSPDVLAMQCIDLDALEASRSGDRDKTMDCLTSIGTFNPERQSFVNPRFLLIELKLNCTNHNLSTSDYTGKVTHTRTLLSGVALHPTNIFLFTESVKSRAKQFVERMSRGSSGKLLGSVAIMSPTDFNNYIGFTHQFPYKPTHSAASITNEISSAASDSQLLVNAFEKWKDIAVGFFYSGNSQETKHIASVLHTEFDRLTLADEDRSYLSLLLDELPR
ncbi:MAG: hypothetical protein NC418_03600 [Muribaculaceae bacterium]|nr:hypothetical protein [Muribaculaceae bacterium]